MPSARRLIKSLLGTFDIAVVRHSTLEKHSRDAVAARDLERLLTLPNEHASQLLKYLPQSKSQLRQDLFVLSQLNFKRNGYFVEFGAADGIHLSNTQLLESQFGWTGILAEPARCWHEALRLNRKAVIEDHCVWKDSSSTLTFNEATFAELSTIATYSDADLHKASREHGRTYEVRTISLNDLLVKHAAPSHIDYLSIDTEGSELDILSSFDFRRHSFGVITCEHNFAPARERIFDLLSRQGYVRKFESLSQFDDWYVKPD